MDILEAELLENMKDSFTFSDPLGETSRIGPFSRINLIVGPNNSGKSIFLRSLYLSVSEMRWFPNSGEHKRLAALRQKAVELLQAEDNEPETEPAYKEYYQRCRENCKNISIPFANIQSD